MSLARRSLLLLTVPLLGAISPVAAQPVPDYQVWAMPGIPSTMEVILDRDGPLGYRTRALDGTLEHPSGDVVLLDETWWTPLRPLQPVASTPVGRTTLRKVRKVLAPAADGRRADRLTALAAGDVNQDGATDLVLSFRRPFRHTFINITRPRDAWVDGEDLSAHVGLYRPHDLSEIWVAGTLVRPVVDLAVCDGALAVAYGRFDEVGTVATDAWRWVEFGFLPAGQLPGAGTPTCVDIDGDGRTEPAILERSDR